MQAFSLLGVRLRYVVQCAEGSHSLAFLFTNRLRGIFALQVSHNRISQLAKLLTIRGRQRNRLTIDRVLVALEQGNHFLSRGIFADDAVASRLLSGRSLTLQTPTPPILALQQVAERLPLFRERLALEELASQTNHRENRQANDRRHHFRVIPAERHQGLDHFVVFHHSKNTPKEDTCLRYFLPLPIKPMTRTSFSYSIMADTCTLCQWSRIYLLSKYPKL